MKQTKIIPFDLSLVTNDNVYTRDGRKVRIICTDRKHDTYPILALTPFISDDDKEEEYFESYKINGHVRHDDREHSNDLFIHQEIDVTFYINPFDKVLVRHGEHGIWRPAFYSHKSMQDNGDNELVELHYVIGDRRGYNNILPYDDFKHLCNTTDEPTF